MKVSESDGKRPDLPSGAARNAVPFLSATQNSQTNSYIISGGSFCYFGFAIARELKGSWKIAVIMLIERAPGRWINIMLMREEDDDYLS